MHVYNLKSDDSVIAGFVYDYDPAGNRTGVLEFGGDRVTWTYDALGNRLVKDASGALTTSTYGGGNGDGGLFGGRVPSRGVLPKQERADHAGS